jgi:hypothetical protein
MQQHLNQVVQLVSSYVPNILGAIAILIIGWLLALIISAIIRGVLRKTSLDIRLAKWIGGKEKAEEIPMARYISKTVYYLALLFVLIAFFQALGLTIITEPLNQFLTQVFAFAPQILAAVALLVVAWILASFLRMIILRSLSKLKVDERFGDQADLEKDKQVPLSKTIANAVYWLIFLLFLPAILDSLELKGLLGSVQGMTNEILEFFPNIFTSALILIIGWFLATIVKRITVNLSAAVGIDRLSEKVGLVTVLGKKKSSEVLGVIVYVLILIPVLISTLEALSLEAITQPASNMLHMILSALPIVFAAALIIIVSYIVGKILSTLVSNLLTSIGFNSIWVKLGLAKEEKVEKNTPSNFIGYLVLIAIIFFASIEALRILNFENVAQIVSQFTVFAGNILLGVIIFAIGLFLANLVSKKIRESKMSQANLYAVMTRIAILVLVISMALREMGFANEIIIVAFGLCLGAIAIATAVAFGIGGRDIAAQKLNEWTKKL